MTVSNADPFTDDLLAHIDDAVEDKEYREILRRVVKTSPQRAFKCIDAIQLLKQCEQKTDEWRKRNREVDVLFALYNRMHSELNTHSVEMEEAYKQVHQIFEELNADA